MARRKTPGPGPEKMPNKKEQGPKVKRLSLYPQNREPFTTEYTKEHPSGRPVLGKGRKKEVPPADEESPIDRIRRAQEQAQREAQRQPQFQQPAPPPVQQPVQQAPIRQVPEQQPAQPQDDGGWGWILGIFIVMVVVIFVALGDDGGGGNGCPTTCTGRSITVAAGCNCPSDSTYYNTIQGSTCHGCKQCICD